MKSLNTKHILIFALFIGLFGTTGKSYSTTFAHSEDEYQIVIEKPATLVGGLDALVKKVSADPALKGKGKLYLLVYVNTSGDVDDVKVVKGVGGNENKAVEIVSKAKFTPGMNNNAPVKCKVAIALNLN